MGTLTAKEQEALNELKYVLDLSGFHRNVAYNVIGIYKPAAMKKVVGPGVRKIKYDSILALTACIKEALATGEYPDCIIPEKETEQLSKLYNDYLLKQTH